MRSSHSASSGCHAVLRQEVRKCFVRGSESTSSARHVQSELGGLQSFGFGFEHQLAGFGTRLHDGRQLAAAFALGACGVQVGTCLLASEECPIHENYKLALLKAKDSDTIVTGRRGGPPADSRRRLR